VIQARGAEALTGVDGDRCARACPPKVGRAARRGKLLAAVLSVCVAALAPACNKGPARAAIAETDQALALARPELERYAPEDLARITAEADAARGRLAAGQYTTALRIAQTLPERIAQASAKASARRDALTPAWTGIAGSLPASVEALRARIGELDASHRPRGYDPTAIDAVKAELGGVQAARARAEAAFRAGDVREAVRIGTDAQARAAALATRLESSPSRAPVVAPSSARPGAPTPTSARTPTSAPAQPEAPAPRSEPPQLPPAADAPPPPDTPPPDTTPDTTVPPGMEQR